MNVRGAAKRFADDRKGAVAIVFALSLLPLAVASGAASDYSRATQVRVDVQSATDAAALASGGGPSSLDNRVQARQAFEAGFQGKWGSAVTHFDVIQTTRKMTVNVDASVPLAFGSMLGRQSLKVNAQAEVPLDDRTVEVDSSLTPLARWRRRARWPRYRAPPRT
jgi:Flp pilus assembly protein TadG